MFSKIVFLEPDRSLELAIESYYMPNLVWLSVLSAIFASYTAFFVSEQICISESVKHKIAWVVSGSVTLGFGVWTMHIVAMLALVFPITVNYDVPNTLISILPVILASFFVLRTTDKQNTTNRELLLRSMLMGGGVGLMHFLGMEAMSMEGSIRYEPKMFVLSLLFANVLAWISLRLKLWASTEVSVGKLVSPKIMSASVIMGCAIAGMHYTGMTAMYVFPDVSPQIQGMTWTANTLAIIIAVITLWMGLFLIVVIRVNERIEFYRQIKDSEAKQRIILKNVADAIISIDKKGLIQSFNTAAENTFGYHAKEIMMQHIDRLLPEDDQHRHWVYDNASKYEPNLINQAQELKGQHKNGTLFVMEANFSPITQKGIQGYVCIMRDITERKQAEEKILYQAHFDALTDLPNRFLALDRLAQLISEAQRNDELIAVLFLDLDDFKKINDTLGHETGDKLLIEVAKRLNSASRKGDTVGRLGGDEFIVLLGGLVDGADARPFAENLLTRSRDAFRIDGRELMLTVSVGIAIFPADGDNASELLRNADSAMYHSKQLGRNTYSFFTHEMNRDVSRRFVLEEQLHGALEEGEFEVFYQPKVAISSGKIVGAEALLRWHNPVLGHVLPEEFIPLAEQIGVIIPIGQFVLNEALGIAAQWHKEHGTSFRIAVNLSPRQFRDPELVGWVGRALKQSGVSADSLELEITEGLLMSGHSYIDDALVTLSNMGISLAMDDFGIGYSSLNYLRRYPFNVLKIDRSFISDITADPADRELVNAAIAMAHALNLKVVAEGVETKEQLANLNEMGCDHGQGYLFGKPMPGGEMIEKLEPGVTRS